MTAGTLRTPRAAIIGAGIGGLTSAIDLARQGFQVDVFERSPTSGGKARTVEVDGRTLDAGPTVLTMPWVFDELFDAAGASFRSEVRLQKGEVIARHRWPRRAPLDLFADRGRSAEAIGDAFGARDARAFLDFCADAQRIYEVAETHFLLSERLTLQGVFTRFGAAGLRTLTSLDSHRTMWAALQRRFREPRLRQLFGRYATYTGCSPFEAPATLNLISHVEGEGVYRAQGGMGHVVAALEGLARRLGVGFHFGADVSRIQVKGGRVAGVATDGAVHAADAVVFNGDVAALGAGLLGEGATQAVSPTPSDWRSASAVTWALVVRTEGFPLVHHNVFFSDDPYRNEFEAIFRRGGMPRSPTVYVCAQDRGDASVGPDAERLLVIVNAPPNGDAPGRWDDGERERCTMVMESVLRRAGWRLSIPVGHQATPREFHQRFPGTGGALYGVRSKGVRSALSRMGASTRIPGLYLAGGSVHPGAGVPMAALSGRLAAAQVVADRPSIAGFPSMATTGTTSTV